MERDIHFAKKAGVDGVVFGCLTPNGTLDIPLTKRLMEAAKGLSVTFHRAFDQCNQPLQAMEQLIELGCDRILTSGQRATAEEGVLLIKELVQKAANRIIILPGSGINDKNIAYIAKETNAIEFHFSARENRESKMIFRSTDVPMNCSVTGNQYIQAVTTANKVRTTIQALKAI